jgi:lysylphosphatidylglycerol synthetase-like protein (DUF2156 family)
MDSFFFLVCVAGVVWLAIWSIRDQNKKSRGWWPFDMRESEQARRARSAPRPWRPTER